jgi:hypothetical protein
MISRTKSRSLPAGVLIFATILTVGNVFPAVAGDGPHSHGHHLHVPGSSCVCEAARSSNGWCDACGVGYVASLRIPSALLYELLDPHGHEVDLSEVSCTTCRWAMSTDGFCEAHRIGYVGGRAYVTRLAYLGAKGEAVQESQEYLRLKAALDVLDTCEYCALALFENGRCPKCNVYYRDGKKIPTPTREASP